MTEHTTNEELIEFRLTKLEDAVSSLSVIKDTVLKWDSRFSEAGGFMQCPIHTERLRVLTDRVDGHDKDIDEMKKFVYKMTGALVVISILIQLVGPMLLDHWREHKSESQQQSQVVTTNTTIPIWGP